MTPLCCVAATGDSGAHPPRAFSTYHLQGYQASAANTPAVVGEAGRLSRQQRTKQRQPSPTSQQMAQTAYEFVVKNMYDRRTGMFHWNVTEDGRVIQNNKVIYGQWFVLYSFSQYYRAFDVARARKLALLCFRAIDAAWHSDQYGGYDELPENQIPPTPEEPRRKPAVKKLVSSRTIPATTGPASKAGQAGDATRAATAATVQRQPSQPVAVEQQVRTLNVAMHGLEALTALHKVTNGEQA